MIYKLKKIIFKNYLQISLINLISVCILVDLAPTLSQIQIFLCLGKQSVL